MQFKLGDIRPNPYRQIERYPLRQEKIAALRASIGSTGFWDNILARVNDQGLPELAYGHHRLEALRQEYDPDHEIDLIVRDLDDEAMIKIMAAENMEEYGSDFTVTMETARAVVTAYAEGKIELNKPPSKTPHDQLRCAPSFVQGSAGTRARTSSYTADTVRSFLGWPEHRAGYALQALEYVELDYVHESKFVGLSLRQARVLLTQTIETRKQQEKAALFNEATGRAAVKADGRGAKEYAAEAQARATFERDVETTQEVVESLADKFREGTVADVDAPKVAQQLRNTLISAVRRLHKRAPNLTTWVNGLCTSLSRILNYDKDKPYQQLAKLLEDDGTGQAYICHLSQHDVDRIIKSLQAIDGRARAHIARIEAARAGEVVSPVFRMVTRPTLKHV